MVLLLPPLMFALVSAIANPNVATTPLTKEDSGTLIPTVLVPGLRFALSSESSLLLSRRV